MSSVGAALLATARLPFLPLTLLCAGLGVLLAGHHGAVDYLGAALAVLAALLAHLAVNWRNEAEDFYSGLDALTERTPFSGGSGYLPAHPLLAPPVARAATVATLLVALIGALLAYHQPLLWGAGALGLALVWFYTSWITRHPWLCAVSPGLAFGPVMVVGSELAASGQLHSDSLLLSAVVFFAVNNLLLLNQLPDAEADHQVGRSTLATALSIGTVKAVAMGSTGCAGVLLLGGIAAGTLPAATGWALLPLAGMAVAALHINDAIFPIKGRTRLALTLNTVSVLATVAALNWAVIAS